MIIGIHAKGAFQKERTGVEEYVYQLIKHLAMLDESADHKFTLYTSTNSETDLYLDRALYLPLIEALKDEACMKYISRTD